MGDAFKKPMGPCIKPKRRLSEGHRGSLYEAQEEAWFGWFELLEWFHRETILYALT